MLYTYPMYHLPLICHPRLRLVTRGHFRSRDKDGGHTINPP